MMSATSAETLSSFLILKISNIFFISFFYRVLGIPLFLQEEPYQEKVYRDADAEGGYLFLLSILLSAPYDLDAFLIDVVFLKFCNPFFDLSLQQILIWQIQLIS